MGRLGGQGIDLLRRAADRLRNRAPKIRERTVDALVEGGARGVTNEVSKTVSGRLSGRRLRRP